MNFKVLFFLILIGAILICVIGVILIIKNTEGFGSVSTIRNDPSCVCAFDLDDTITCGIERAANVIKHCKDLGCKLAINTARPGRSYSDLNLQGLGLKIEDFESDFYNGSPFQCSFTDTKCFVDAIANTKVDHLHTLSIKWGIEPRRVILFDDQIANVEKARQAGFSAILANHPDCGLSDDTITQIDKILNVF